MHSQGIPTEGKGTNTSEEVSQFDEKMALIVFCRQSSAMKKQFPEKAELSEK